MKPNDKAFEAAIAEGKRWDGSDFTGWRVLREDDIQNGWDIVAEFDNREERDEALERLRAEAVVNAAFAAQFQPSEDYAGLIEWLRDKAESLSEIYPPEAEAADAFEAVLAERDAAKRSAYEDAARFIEENVFNYSSGDQNYWSHRKGDNTHGLEYAREFRARAALEGVTEPSSND